MDPTSGRQPPLEVGEQHLDEMVAPPTEPHDDARAAIEDLAHDCDPPALDHCYLDRLVYRA